MWMILIIQIIKGFTTIMVIAMGVLGAIYLVDRYMEIKNSKK